jgi:hypothetical protein
VPDPSPSPPPWYKARPATRWGRAALLLAPLVYLDWEVYAGWARGEYTLKPAIVFWWLLLPPQLAVLWGALPDALSPGPYPPPPAPRRFARRWSIAAPGVPYGFAFPAAMLAVAVAVTTASVFAARGPDWTVGGVLGTAAAGTGLAAGLGFLLRTRPRLDVGEDRRELVWRPGTPLGGTLTLPFAAVVSVDVVTTGPGRHHPEVRWHSNKGRVVSTRLPAGASREQVEAVVARLRAALAG